jgi:hypothetical protein
VTVAKAAARAAAPPPTRFLAPSRGLRSTTAAYAAPRDTAPTDSFAPGLEPGVTSTTFSYRGAIQPSWRHSIWSSALGGCAGTLGCRAAGAFLAVAFGRSRRGEQRGDQQPEGVQRVRLPRRAHQRLGVFVLVEQVHAE